MIRAFRLAFNAPDSLSGHLALLRDIEAQTSGLHIFNDMLETGGHRACIRAVAEGRADVATVDAKIWQLAQWLEPASWELVIVGWTGRRKGSAVGTVKLTGVTSSLLPSITIFPYIANRHYADNSYVHGSQIRPRPRSI